jgi:hypothetical protein
MLLTATHNYTAGPEDRKHEAVAEQQTRDGKRPGVLIVVVLCIGRWCLTARGGGSVASCTDCSGTASSIVSDADATCGGAGEHGRENGSEMFSGAIMAAAHVAS